VDIIKDEAKLNEILKSIGKAYIMDNLAKEGVDS